jgi:hypothetical protein
MQYIRDYYKVPAEIGRAVTVYGKPGVIVADRGHYIGVTFDEDKPNVILPCHPTDGVEYGEMRGIRKMTKAQQRYQDYLEMDWFDSFGDYLRSGLAV